MRMGDYANSSLGVDAEVQGLLAMTKHQDECEIQDILNIGGDPLKAEGYKV